MYKPQRIVIISLISFFVFLLAALGLYRITKVGTLLPTKYAHRSGVMYFEGNKQAVVGQPFSLQVMIDSSEQNVNAVGFYLRFDPQKISITEVSTLNSFCQFYPEKKYDNQIGIVSLACGSPHPGFKGKNELIRLTITPLTIGTTYLRVSSDSQLLLSNGKGTNILTEYPTWEVQIGAAL